MKNIFAFSANLSAKPKVSLINTFKELDWILFLLLIFFLPLVFLPFTPDVLEFNKQAVLAVGSTIIAVIFLVKSIIRGSLRISGSFVHVAVLLVSLSALLSTLFSQDKTLSFLGFGFGSHETFLTQLSLALLYFVIVSSFNEQRIILFIKTFIVAGVIIGLLRLLLVSGVFSSFATSDFSTIGSPSLEGLFIAASLAASIGAVLFWKGIAQKLALISAIFMFVVGAILFQNTIWNIFAVVVSFMLLTHLLMFRRSKNSVLASIFLGTLIGLSIGFIFFAPLRSFIPASLEISPSLGLSLEIAKQSLIDNPMFGIGPSNWIMAYGKYFPAELNIGDFWNISFVQSGSRFLTLLVTGGMVYALVWLVFVFAVGFTGIRKLYALERSFVVFRMFSKFIPKFLKTSSSADSSGEIVQTPSLTVPVFFAWLVMAIGQFVLSGNITTESFFWILSAVLVALVLPKADAGTSKAGDKKTGIFIFSKDSLAFQFLGIVAAILFIVLAGEGIILAKRYAATYVFANAVKDMGKSNFKEAHDKAQLAVRLESVKAFYLYGLSNMAVEALTQEATRAFNSEDQKVDVDALKNYSVLAAGAVDSLVIIQPFRAENWYQRAQVYQSLSSFNYDGAENEINVSLDKAIELAPQNPLLVAERGDNQLRSWLASASNEVSDAEKEKMQKLVEESFLKAIELKDDYIPARVGLSILYYHLKRVDEIEIQAQTIMRFAPTNPDAHYLQGLVFDSRGDKENAMLEFEFILQLDPDNEEVKKIIENLKAGKTAFEGVGAEDLPISDISQ